MINRIEIESVVDLRRFTPLISTVTEWVGHTCGAFLVTLLFRSIRLQWRVLPSAPSSGSTPPISRHNIFVTVGVLFLSVPLWWFSMRHIIASDNWNRDIWLAAIGLVLPAMYFCFLARRPDGMHDTMSEELGAIVVRCSFWIGMASFFWLGGMVFPGIGDSVLLMASTLEYPVTATPFALAAIAIKPFSNLFILSGSLAYVGGFLMAIILPASVPSSRRIAASAQGGAILGAVSYVLPVLIALNMAMLTVSLIYCSLGHPPDDRLTSYFGNWYNLSLLNLGVFVAMTAFSALFWAAQALVVCGIFWLINRIRRRNTLPLPSMESLPPSSPSQNQSHAPSE